jgi:ribosomal protein L13
MKQDQIQEWYENPVTIEFFKFIADVIKELQTEPRYTPSLKIGENVILVNADTCALQNAFHEGKILAFKEVIEIKLEGDK